jgi:glyoxylase-like metal-dependent hydrolase (beta-lactamase superfamily II)
MRSFVLALVLSAATAVAADNPETLSERSQARAREILDAAVTAIGGADALQSIDTVRLQLEGKTWPRLQMTTPEPPFEPGEFRETLLFDLKNDRVFLDQQNRGAGFQGHNSTILKATEGANYDHRARTVTPIPAAQLTGQQFIQYHRRLPHLILRQALSNPNSLRHLGEDQFDGRRHDVITFVMPDTQQVAVYVDAKTNLISKYELVLTDPLTGEDVSEIMFSDYASSGNLKVPQKWGWRIAGDTIASYKVKAEFNPAVDDKAFEIAAAGYRTVAANPPPPAPNVEKLADGIFVIQNVAGPNQNSLAVEFRDFIAVVEAPGTSAGSEAVIERIREAIPGKPIRYVAMTHHHGDHIGGLRTFIAEGATVVTTPANRRVVETMARAPQKDRLARSPRKLEFAFLENGKRVFTDGTQTLELIDIGPNPHAREMVVAYLPKHRVVFQGDLFFIPNNDAPLGPPQAGTVSFAQQLKARGLDVTRIASVHGRTATIEELHAAMEESAAIRDGDG